MIKNFIAKFICKFLDCLRSISFWFVTKEEFLRFNFFVLHCQLLIKSKLYGFIYKHNLNDKLIYTDNPDDLLNLDYVYYPYEFEQNKFLIITPEMFINDIKPEDFFCGFVCLKVEHLNTPSKNLNYIVIEPLVKNLGD